MTTTRREFLKTTAVLGGGLTLGVFLSTQADEAQAAGTVHTPNAWVHIADDNTITLLSARSEMGQGVYTAMPMLIAEELGVDIRKIKVDVRVGSWGMVTEGLKPGERVVVEGGDRVRAGQKVRLAANTPAESSAAAK